MILCKSGMRFKEMKNFQKESQELDCEVVAIELNDFKVTIVTSYRSPNGDFSIFCDSLR